MIALCGRQSKAMYSPCHDPDYFIGVCHGASGQSIIVQKYACHALV